MTLPGSTRKQIRYEQEPSPIAADPTWLQLAPSRGYGVTKVQLEATAALVLERSVMYALKAVTDPISTRYHHAAIAMGCGGH